MSLTRQRSPLFWAVWLSVLVHAGLLTLHFQPELKKFKDQIPVLEVMLVNSKSKQAPEKADALAQNHLDRGGNTDEKRQMKSPLPNTLPMPSQASEARLLPAQPPTARQQQDSELQLEKQRVAKLEQEAQALLTQLQARQAVSSLQTAPRKQVAQAASKPEHSPEHTRQMRDATRMALQEMAKLEALIAKQQEAYESRPKRQFVGARTREYRFANYVEHWRQKVERVGNLNYPETAKAQKLYGQLQMTVSIRADGSLEEIHIQRSSGHKLLDEAARRIVQMAAPFDAFPAEVRQDTDILSITRTWTFSQQDGLVSE